MHHHDFYEIYFFLSGKVSYRVENRTYPLQPGDILLISPLELHQPIIAKEKRSYERIVLWVSKSCIDRLSRPRRDELKKSHTLRSHNIGYIDAVQKSKEPGNEASGYKNQGSSEK